MSGKHGTSTTTESQTITPTNPQWVTDAVQGLTNNTTGLLAQDPKSFFAGPQGLNQQRFDIAGGIADAAPGVLQKSVDLASNLGPTSFATAAGYNPAMMTAAQIGPTALAHGKTAYGGIDNYLNPAVSYQASNLISNMDRARQLATNTNGQGAALAGQYGGSRQGVLDANTNRDFYDQLGSKLSDIYAGSFNTALGAANSDADRAQQANLTNVNAVNTQNLNQAQLGQQASINNQNANNQAWQFNAGNAQQTSQFNAGQANNSLDRQLQASQLLGGLGQFGLNYLGDSAGSQQSLAQLLAGAPLAVNGALTDSLGALPLNLFNGRDITGTSHNSQTQFGGSVGDIAKIALAAMSLSDPRVKKDVIHLGRDPMGRNVYAYQMIGDPPGADHRIGVMADETAHTDPEAVAKGPDGLLRVNYPLLAAKNAAATGQPGVSIPTPVQSPQITPTQQPTGLINTLAPTLNLGQDQSQGSAHSLMAALQMLAGGGGGGGGAAGAAGGGQGGAAGAVGGLTDVGSDTKLDLEAPAPFRLVGDPMGAPMMPRGRRGLFNAFVGQ